MVRDNKGKNERIIRRNKWLKMKLVVRWELNPDFREKLFLLFLFFLFFFFFFAGTSMKKLVSENLGIWCILPNLYDISCGIGRGRIGRGCKVEDSLPPPLTIDIKKNIPNFVQIYLFFFLRITVFYLAEYWMAEFCTTWY